MSSLLMTVKMKKMDRRVQKEVEKLKLEKRKINRTSKS